MRLVDPSIELVAVRQLEQRHADLRLVGGDRARAHLRASSTTSRCTPTTSSTTTTSSSFLATASTWTCSSTRSSPPPTTSARGSGSASKLRPGLRRVERLVPAALRRGRDRPRLAVRPAADRGQLHRRRRGGRRQLPDLAARPRRPGRRSPARPSWSTSSRRSCTEPGGPAWRQTIFYPFAQAARFARGRVLRPLIESSSYATARFGDVPMLHATATYDDETGELSLFAVNRSTTETSAVDRRRARASARCRSPTTPSSPTTTCGPATPPTSPTASCPDAVRAPGSPTEDSRSASPPLPGTSCDSPPHQPAEAGSEPDPFSTTRSKQMRRTTWTAAARPQASPAPWSSPDAAAVRGGRLARPSPPAPSAASTTGPNVDAGLLERLHRR